MPYLEIILVSSVISIACVLPGVFLVLRKVSLMSDAISHSILLGIVVAFLIIKNLHSPLLIVGAALAGILTVFITEVLIHSRRLKKDAAIGLIFPIFFSIGVILINKFASDVHLDNDAVLLGEIAYAPLNRLYAFGIDLGPMALWIMLPILILNAVFIYAFYKELKLSSFDPGLATALGFSPVLIHYSLMSLVSITAVGAFDAVGSILVVALMITPPATAYLLTERVSKMIAVSIAIAIASSITGVGIAVLLDASIAGCIVTMTGIFFLLALCFSPQQGLVFKYFFAKKQRILFSAHMFIVHMSSHEGTPTEKKENTIQNMTTHMNWSERFSNQVSKLVIQESWVKRDNKQLKLTPLGREIARAVITR
jgi:manganese/zinc/iron transport system permease protein